MKNENLINLKPVSLILISKTKGCAATGETWLIKSHGIKVIIVNQHGMYSFCEIDFKTLLQDYNLGW